MKELSIEEKAKAYDEALKQIKECVPDDNGFITIYPQEIFPELAESEDERIRKALIENFKFFGGEHLKTSKWGKDDDLLVTDILAWLEKQGEQKPADWSEEDEAYRRLLLDIMDVEHRGGIFSINPEDISIFKSDVVKVERIKDWLKSLRPNHWKPSDEQMGALEYSTRLFYDTERGNYYKGILEDLLEQLKKL